MDKPSTIMPACRRKADFAPRSFWSAKQIYFDISLKFFNPSGAIANRVRRCMLLTAILACRSRMDCRKIGCDICEAGRCGGHGQVSFAHHVQTENIQSCFLARLCGQRNADREFGALRSVAACDAATHVPFDDR